MKRYLFLFVLPFMLIDCSSLKAQSEGAFESTISPSFVASIQGYRNFSLTFDKKDTSILRSGAGMGIGVMHHFGVNSNFVGIALLSLEDFWLRRTSIFDRSKLLSLSLGYKPVFYYSALTVSVCLAGRVFFRNKNNEYLSVFEPEYGGGIGCNIGWLISRGGWDVVFDLNYRQIGRYGNWFISIYAPIDSWYL